ncbi:unnamed protein product [Cyclocybe aegerita]|uniref:Uncharacterized protein n=1 Tax=Cyclocybe aegerita TaxID=1973307 RepID=A0A8S0WW74_CYCAE|nr:unnamed protein product [Cyclocybe aegerita]
MPWLSAGIQSRPRLTLQTCGLQEQAQTSASLSIFNIYSYELEPTSILSMAGVISLVFGLFERTLELCYILSVAIFLFLYLPRQPPKSLAEPLVCESLPEAAAEPSDDTTTEGLPRPETPVIVYSSSYDDSLSIISPGTPDDTQNSFFMVSFINSPLPEPHSPELVKSFSRLKIQSQKTLQALVENRRKMTGKCYAEVRKQRLRRARAVTVSRHCYFSE